MAADFLPLPEPLSPPHRPRPPEALLADDVIELALDDLREGLGRNLRSALEFFTGDPPESAFLFWAEMGGWEPEPIRAHARKIVQERFTTKAALTAALDVYQRDDRTDPRAAASH